MQDTKITGIPAIELLPHPETGVLVPEEWRNIIGYEGYYQISNYGRVKSIPRKGIVNGLILKQSLNHKGYPRIRFCKNYIKSTSTVHRLVANAFIPNPKNKPQVNHKNGIKINNFLYNLEWSTGLENMRHGFSSGLFANRPVGIHHPCATLTEDQVLEIRRLVLLPNRPPTAEIAEMFNAKESNIYKIIARTIWKHI